jgi:hypothetical protein
MLPTLKSYYPSFESRIVYRLVLSDIKRFRYYVTCTYWPLPISEALKGNGGLSIQKFEV